MRAFTSPPGGGSSTHDHLGEIGEHWHSADGFLCYRPGPIVPLRTRPAYSEKQLRSLLGLGLPRNVQNAILRELGVAPRRYHNANAALCDWIQEGLRKAGQSVEEIAKQTGTSVEALRRQRTRLAKKRRP